MLSLCLSAGIQKSLPHAKMLTFTTSPSGPSPASYWSRFSTVKSKSCCEPPVVTSIYFPEKTHLASVAKRSNQRVLFVFLQFDFNFCSHGNGGHTCSMPEQLPPPHPTPLGPDHHKPRRTSPPSHYKSAGRGLKVGESVSEARVRHLLRCDPIFDVTECILFIFFARLCRSQLCRSMTNKKRHGKQNSNSSKSDGGEREGGGTTQYK